MNVLDVNVVIPIFRADHANHQVAKDWWTRSRANGEPFTVPDVVWLAFTRIVTDRRAFATPASFKDAWLFAEAMMLHATYLRFATSTRTVDEFVGLALEAGAAGNLLTDAYIAACAAAYGGTVVTFDRDFRKFDGLRVLELAA